MNGPNTSSPPSAPFVISAESNQSREKPQKLLNSWLILGLLCSTQILRISPLPQAPLHPNLSLTSLQMPLSPFSLLFYFIYVISSHCILVIIKWGPTARLDLKYAGREWGTGTQLHLVPTLSLAPSLLWSKE